MATESQSHRARRLTQRSQRSQSISERFDRPPSNRLCVSVSLWQSFRSSSAISAISALIVVSVFSAGCRRDMHDQPKYIPLRQSTFFGDERSARPLVPGTVARGHLHEDTLVETGKAGDGDGMVVRRGFRRPPSYHDERLRMAPAGHFVDVMTNGFGAMADYRQQV